MNKIDRCILITAIGILIVSIVITADRVYTQNIKKENIRIDRQEEITADTMNIHIWRTYHQEQMHMMKQILIELKKQNKELELTKYNNPTTL